ncbi:Protein ecm33 [Paramyrothecium foliicola]|nr:Protein ecm33 [Paramyrothecium foliicola]
MTPADPANHHLVLVSSAVNRVIPQRVTVPQHKLELILHREPRNSYANIDFCIAHEGDSKNASMKQHAQWALALGLAWSPYGAVAAENLKLKQTLGCSSSTGYVISAPSDIDDISDCSTVKGSVSIQFADNPSAWTSDAEIDLGEITTILGNLTIYPSARHKSTKVTASKLENLDGGITIWNTDFSSSVDNLEVSLPKLRSVQDTYAITGGIRKITIKQTEQVTAKELFRVWSSNVEQFSIPGLISVEGEANVDSNAELKELDLSDLSTVGSSLRVQTNGKLSTIDFKDLKRVDGDIQFYQNPALTDLTLPNLEFADTISITSNGPNPSVFMPRLSALGNFNTTETSTFEDIGDLDLPFLSEVTGGLGFQSTNLADLTIPALKSLNGSITAKKNAKLEVLALPRLQSLGDIFVESNDLLSNFTANALTQAGTISIKGKGLTNIEFFALKKVTGDFKISGTDSMDCTWFDEHVKPIVNGIFTCGGSYNKLSEERKPSTGGIENVPVGSVPDDSQDNGSSPNDSNEVTKGSSGLSTGAKAGIGAGVALVAVLAAAILFFLIRRRRKGLRIADSISSDDEMRSPSRMTKLDIETSSAEVYDGAKPLKLGVETTIEAAPPPEKEEKRLSLMNFRLSAGLGKGL